MNNIGDRLKHLIERKGITPYKLSLKTNVSQATLSRIINKNTNPNESTTQALCSYFQITEQWLLTGIDENIKEISNPVLEYQPEGKLINEEDYPKKEVYIIPVKGRGGLSNVYFADEAIKKLETEKLQVKQMPSNGSKYFKIEVEGISMDDGSKKSLAEGDWAYCRSIPKIYWNSKLHSHKWDIFCFFHNERGIIFKKIKNQDVDNGILMLTSLHPDKKQFPDFEIKLSECSYICNVIKVLSEF